MVSLRLSHCHSASETFIGRLCWRTRSRTVRRTSSSLRRSSLAILRSSAVATRRIDLRGSGLGAGDSGLPEPPAPSPEPRLQVPHRSHFFAAISPNADITPKSCPRSTSTMTGTSRRSGEVSSDGQVKYSRRFPLNRTSKTLVNSLLGERTHGKVLFFAPFEELIGLEPAKLTEMPLQRIAERRGRRLGIGMGAARRLGDDLVDHAEVQKVLSRDLECLGGALALARILPEDGRAPLGGNH